MRIPHKLHDQIITALILCVTVVARLWNLGGRSLSYDEGFSWHFSTLSLRAILTNTQDPNPPLFCFKEFPGSPGALYLLGYDL